MVNYYLTIVLAPLAAAIIAGLAGKQIGRTGAHWVTIIGVGTSCALSFVVLRNMFWGGAEPENIGIYTWAVVDGLHMGIGFLVDRLTALMMCVAPTPKCGRTLRHMRSPASSPSVGSGGGAKPSRIFTRKRRSLCAGCLISVWETGTFSLG